MAESLDDGEFWLPPQFLTDDEVIDESGGVNLKKNGDGLGLGVDVAAEKMGLFSFDSPFGGFGSIGGSSDLSSPVESVVGSTETESDEEDFMAGLTLQMARSTVGDALCTANTKGRSLSGSPQSTLCSAGSGCMCRKESSRGSPNGPWQVSAPPATWDLLYAAAGEVARMKMNNTNDDRKEYGFNSSNRSYVCVAPPRNPSPVTNPKPNLDAAFYHHQRIQAAQLQMLKQQQLQQRSGVWRGPVKGTGHFQPQQVVHNRPRNSEFIGGGGGGGGGGCRSVRPLGLSPSAWPPLQQAQPPQHHQNVPGMRAMFLGAPGGAKRECAGTGVFLPRRKVGASEPKKKPVCSTVLLPARVVQALNLNLDNMGAQAQLQNQNQNRFNGSYTAENERLRSNNALYSPQRRSNNLVMNQEIRLPQEWTY